MSNFHLLKCASIFIESAHLLFTVTATTRWSTLIRSALGLYLRSYISTRIAFACANYYASERNYASTRSLPLSLERVLSHSPRHRSHAVTPTISCSRDELELYCCWWDATAVWRSLGTLRATQPPFEFDTQRVPFFFWSEGSDCFVPVWYLVNLKL